MNAIDAANKQAGQDAFHLGPACSRLMEQQIGHAGILFCCIRSIRLL